MQHSIKIVKNDLEIGKISSTVTLNGETHDSKLGFFVKPAIFTDVFQDAKINKEKIFGPVAVVHTFNDEKEVLKQANDTEYGLYCKAKLCLHKQSE